MTDGPFAETKEQLGGYYLLECADLDEALAWAKKVPTRPGNAVEVWPAMDFSGFGYEDPVRGRGEGLTAAHRISTSCSGASRDGRSPP